MSIFPRHECLERIIVASSKSEKKLGDVDVNKLDQNIYLSKLMFIMLNSSGTQSMFRNTVVCRHRIPGVSRKKKIFRDTLNLQ
jgi:hypothetical protein